MVHNILKVGIRQKFPKLKIIVIIISVFTLAITSMSLLIHFLRKKTPKKATKRRKEE